MSECVFCKIADGRIPAQAVWQDDHVLAFRDIRPLAPVHILFIPKSHIETFGDLAGSGEAILASLARGVRDVTAAEGLTRTGYRILSNNGPDAGQEVPHVHLHLLGGRDLGPMLLAEGER
jgi:histidine triad (HIT) family protein